jgi:hypothetical protein
MRRQRSASNVLEFLLATLVMGCLLGMLVPVVYKVHEVCQKAKYVQELKQSGSLDYAAKSPRQSLRGGLEWLTAGRLENGSFCEINMIGTPLFLIFLLAAEDKPTPNFPLGK